jgi:hypothetical protein
MIRIGQIAMITLLLGLSSAKAGTAQSSVVIRLDSHPNTEQHHSISEFFLKATSQGIQCSTKSVPEHVIKPQGLRSIQAPYKNQAVPRNCEYILSWGKAKTCYRRGANPIVDDTLRWCSQL